MPGSLKPNTCTPTGRWNVDTRCRPSLLAMSHVWKSPTGQDYVLATKGAPEAIADLCHLNADRTKAIGEQVAAMAQDGLRVLGVAKGVFGQQALPGEQHDFTFEFLGLVGLADPVRPTVPAAVEECYTAGIRVVMITGDHPTTAKSIARQAGIKPVDEIITGPELEKLDEAELQLRVRTINVFARMVPEQKLRLVNALKANGEVVAMTGDGVNDAPALKAAHIGIAMGGRGTDVAREAASLVLLDDDFASIVHSVRMGRRIYDHLQKAMTYIVAVHVPIAGMSIVPVLLGGPIALMPVHILFLELVIDPACSVVFEAEPEDADLMSRPPRNPTLPLFGSRLLGLGLAARCERLADRPGDLSFGVVGLAQCLGRHRFEFHHACRRQPGPDLCQPLLDPHDLGHLADPECRPLVGHRRHNLLPRSGALRPVPA